VEALKVRFCDEFDGGFGWIVDEFMERCSHALVANGRVWLVDPVAADGVEERIRAAGEPVAVFQLLDRHNRDCAELAARLGVGHYVLPRSPLAGRFSFLPVRTSRRWDEVALWWQDRGILVCADALGTARYYRAGSERLAVHPFLRLFPPQLLRGTKPLPQRILCGHGEGVHDGAEVALCEALRTARRRIPAQFASAVRAWRATRSA
jgi:hypothetical protein